MGDGSQPIPGLYAAGDTTRGIMIPGDVGVGYIERVFSALTQAFNEGYIAGVAATEYLLSISRPPRMKKPCRRREDPAVHWHQLDRLDLC